MVAIKTAHVLSESTPCPSPNPMAEPLEAVLEAQKAILQAPTRRVSTYLISLFGTVAEYYDWALYGYCAALLSVLFFADSNPNIALLKTYGLFALGSMGKPIGSIVFGWLGDRFGRSFVLRRSMIGIAVPTTIIALTPDQQSWGVLSAIIILLCRFMQGVFVSGESDGVRIYIYESKIAKYPYVANSLVISAMIIGAFLASLASTFALANADTWLWRLPFIFGGLLGLIVFYLRQKISDLPHKIKTSQPSTIPLNWRGILATILLMGSVGGTYQLFFVFRPTFMAKLSTTILAAQAQETTTLALCIFMPAAILAGLLAERIGGRKVVFMGALSLIALSTVFGEELVTSVNNLPLFIAFVGSIGMLYSPAFILVIRQFAPEVRFRCGSIGHSLGHILFSGSAAFMATFLWDTFNTPKAFAYHLIFLSCLVLASLALLTKPVARHEELK